jgi:endoglucanase
MLSIPLRRRRSIVLLAAAAAVAGQALLPGPALAAEDKPLPASTTFFTPVPDQGALRQIVDLGRAHRFRDAELIAREVATPQAAWFTDGDAAQVRRDVRRTTTLAAATRAVPTLVAYDVPGRDCSQYSAGGASDDAAYRAWADGFAAGLVKGQRIVVIVEPDGLALLPSDCAPGTYDGVASPPTDEGRIADITYLGRAVEKADPQALVYLDAGHNKWHNVGDISSRLERAAVTEFQGFSLDTSNYQWTPDLEQYGTWISDCIAYTTQVAVGDFASCGDQYWSGGPANNWTGVALDPYQQWSDTAAAPEANTAGINSRYAAQLGTVVPTAHFVIDTSRNGQGPWQPTATYPDPQDWCNPPGRGLGPRPQGAPDGNFPQLDAYLWVKTPGQSDGQCNRGVAGSTTDPEWGNRTDPAAGDWFGDQALQLAQLASPPLR